MTYYSKILKNMIKNAHKAEASLLQIVVREIRKIQEKKERKQEIKSIDNLNNLL